MFKIYFRLKLEKPVRDLNRQQVLKPNADPLITWHYRRIEILWRPFMVFGVAGWPACLLFNSSILNITEDAFRSFS